MTAASDRAHLRQLAQAATPGPWAERDVLGLTWPTQIDGWTWPKERRRAQERIDANKAFIAAADPQTIIALCDALDHADERLAAASDVAQETGQMVADSANRAIAERDAARAALDTLHTDVTGLIHAIERGNADTYALDVLPELRALLDRTPPADPDTHTLVCSCGKVYRYDEDPHQWTPPEGTTP